MNDVDMYLSDVPEPSKSELARIRSIVRRLVPDAEESISYMMPAFKYKKKPLIYYAAFKDHLSIFPTSGPTESLKDKLSGYKVSKGTIQFTLENPLPTSLIEEIILARKSQIDK